MIMKKLVLLATICTICANVFSQIGPNLYYIEFTDKNNSPYSIDNPREYLSERALTRRNVQNIAIDSLDLPVNPSYIEGLENLGLEIYNVTKWFNGAVVRTDDYNLVVQARKLPYVKEKSRFEIDTVESVPKIGKKRSATQSFSIPSIEDNPETDSEYGASYDQIALHNGHILHSEGYKGEGMLIAITDGGFINVDKMECFEHLRNSGRIVATRDFAFGNTSVYGHDDHGSMVLSVMAGYMPGKYIGAAPEAEYILIISENGEYEEIVEEFNWISAIEYADSMGVDLANVSLGYSNFDSERYNHSRKSLDGYTNPSSIGASIATSRGMIIVTSAGNSGFIKGEEWIGAPADSYDIIAVGSIDIKENYTYFSSIGFVEKNRIKPDITSIGERTSLIDTTNTIVKEYGTSFSSPLMAGLIACFWQKFRDKTSYEIRQTLFSAARATNPQSEYDRTIKLGTPNIYTGRGIVDFVAASNLMAENNSSYRIELSPNPTLDFITISIDSEKNAKLSIFSSDGNLIDSKENIIRETKYNFKKYPIGKYIVKISVGNNVVFSQAVYKQ